MPRKCTHDSKALGSSFFLKPVYLSIDMYNSEATAVMAFVKANQFIYEPLLKYCNPALLSHVYIFMV